MSVLHVVEAIPNLRVVSVGHVNDAVTAVKQGGETVCAVVAKAGRESGNLGLELFQSIVELGGRDIFTVLFSHTLSRNPYKRYEIMADAGLCIRMVSHVGADIAKAISAIAAYTGTGPFSCALCNKTGMTEHELWHHVPQFHVNEPNVSTADTPGGICGCRSRKQYYALHIRDAHRPSGAHSDQRPHIQLHAYGLAVIQRSDKKFLVVQEFCNQGYWLPGGGIDAGENPLAGARRETLEEAGVDVRLTGLLSVEFIPSKRDSTVKMRYVFYGHPVDDAAEPKTDPDFESVGACWVDVEDVVGGRLPLRGWEPQHWFKYVSDGGQIHSLDVLKCD